MKSLTETIKCAPRENVGTKASRRLRDGGWVPAIIYGHNQPSKSVALMLHDVKLAVSHGWRVVTLDLEGDDNSVLIKEVQYDHLHATPIHVDLTRVSLDERVEVTVPLILRGTPSGAKDGGVLSQSLTELQIECLAAQIPESIRINVANLGIDDSLHVRDIEAPDGARILTREDDLVAAVAVVLEEEIEEEEPESREPEVIGREAEDDEEQEEESEAS
jgi:large subunit ribosomal protein L25